MDSVGAKLEVMSDNWWLMLLRGIVAILFGMMVMAWPGVSLVVLVIFFGAYALVDGIFAIIAALTTHGGVGSRLFLVLEGIVGIVIGYFTFVYPDITATVLLILIAVWALVTGIFEIILASVTWKEFTGKWYLLIGGVASLIFGLIMIINPEAGALVFLWLIGAYAIIFGTLMMVFSIHLKKLKA
ncbi:MAG: HdeD family acid-resistance protein [Chloroflexi bacterium]|nr:HdeD family acid-resistance protein [Chloroflexota bacterium]